VLKIPFFLRNYNLYYRVCALCIVDAIFNDTQDGM
jgi:hypothetical protein